MSQELLRPGSELVLKDASLDLRIKALETLPVPIEFGEVYLTAKGIRRYDGTSTNEEVRNEYFRKCREDGVIPNSTLTIVSLGDQSFHTRRSPVEIVYQTEVYEATKENVVHGLVRGGKFATIKFDIATNGAFSNFKRDHLRQTLDLGYGIESANLALTSYRRTGYNEGTYYGATLIVGRDITVAGDDLPSKQLYERLRPFFAQLRGQLKLDSI